MAKRRTNNKSGETWPGAVKAIGIRALSAGKFWQFCFAGVMAMIAYRIDSQDWVKITQLFLHSYFYSTLGWVLFALTVVASVATFRVHRRIYLKEIDRLSKERTKIQETIIGPPHIKHSEFKPK